MTWIVVADASRARIFTSQTSLSDITEIETLSHPEGRMHEQDLTSDLPGRAFDSSGEGRHAMGQKVDPKQQEAINFAREIADRLDRARRNKQFNRLVLIAAPAMLGLLRDMLDSETARLVVEEIDKDLTQHTVKDISAHLPMNLPA